MLVIVLLFQWQFGYFWTVRGYEFALLWLLLCIAIFFKGGGRYSIDRLIGKEFLIRSVLSVSLETAKSRLPELAPHRGSKGPTAGKRKIKKVKQRLTARSPSLRIGKKLCGKCSMK